MRFFVRYHYSKGFTGATVFHTMNAVSSFITKYLWSNVSKDNPTYASIEDIQDNKTIYVPIFK